MKIQTEYGEVHVLTNCPLLESTERLEFLTEVHESFDGSEERNALRDAPRQILSFKYVQMQKAMGDMFHMLYANLRKYWGIPLRQVKRAIPDIADDDFIILDTTSTQADLKVGFAFIESSEGVQVVEITEIGRYVLDVEELPVYQDGFRLSANITATNAVMMPLRICIIDGDASINAGGFWSNALVVFRVIAEDLPEHDGDVPAQYLGDDIYFKPLVLDGDSLEMTLTQQQSIVDGSIGGFQQFTHHAKPRYMKPFKSVLKDWSEFHEYRRFLFRRMGRLKAFWMPLYEKHLHITNTGTVYNVLNTDTAYFLEADRKHIAVKINDVWTAHVITAKTANTLTVSPALNVPVGSIQKVCYLGLHRFDADQIEFQFLGAGKTQVTVPIVELSS